MRAVRLLRAPHEEWLAIAAERRTVEELYTRYVMVFAAIPPIAIFIGYSLVGVGATAPWRVPFAPGIAQMVLAYVLTLAGVYAMALVINALAPAFGGTRSFIQAFKVAAFAPTAWWIAGAFHAVPVLGIVGLIAGLYSVYLLYAAIPPLMETSADKALPYTLVAIIAAIVVVAATFAISSLVVPARMRGF